MKFGQVIEYNNRNIFLQKSCRKWGSKTSSRPFLFFKKALLEVKASGLQLSFSQFLYSSIWQTIKTKYIQKYSKNTSKNILNFGFVEKGLGIISLPHFCMIFQKKCFSYYTLLTDQISLPDCPYFLRYWYCNRLLTKMLCHRFWN